MIIDHGENVDDYNNIDDDDDDGGGVFCIQGKGRVSGTGFF